VQPFKAAVVAQSRLLLNGHWSLRKDPCHHAVLDKCLPLRMTVRVLRTLTADGMEGLTVTLLVNVHSLSHCQTMTSSLALGRLDIATRVSSSTVLVDRIVTT